MAAHATSALGGGAPGDAPVLSADVGVHRAQAEAEPGEGAASQDAGGLIVDDAAQALTTGQMRKLEFLAEMRKTSCAAADKVLKEVGRSTAGCPYVDKWIDYYSKREAADVERAIQKFVPETKGAKTAREYLDPIATRIAHGARQWATTGKLPELPPELAAAAGGGLGVLGAMGGALGKIGGAIAAIGGAIGKAAKAVGGLFKKGPDGAAEGAGGAVDRGSLEHRLGEGAPLASPARARMEGAFGHGFGDVRVHTDPTAAGLARDLDARAFTVGNHVAFAGGEYAPGTPAGDALLAHELAHVVQQSGGTEAQPALAEPRAGDERDADSAAGDAMRGLYGGKGKKAAPAKGGGMRLSRCANTPKKEAESAKAPEIKDPGACAPALQKLDDPVKPGSAEDQSKGVDQAIDCFTNSVAYYGPKGPGAAKTKDEAFVSKVLGDWKAAYEIARRLLDMLGADEGKRIKLDRAYLDAVEALMASAATAQGTNVGAVRTAHAKELVKDVKNDKASELSDKLSDKEKQKIDVIGSLTPINPITPDQLEELFGKSGGAVLTITPPAPVKFASDIPRKLQPGLSNVCGKIWPSTGKNKVNTTTTVALDLTKYGGDYSTYRYTWVQHNDKQKTEEILIERVGTVGVTHMSTAERAAARKRFDDLGLRVEDGFNETDFESVLAAINELPESIAKKLDGVTFRRRAAPVAGQDCNVGQTKVDAAAGGQYSETGHQICLYDKGFKRVGMVHGGPGRGDPGSQRSSTSDETVREVLHEVGHALDRRNIRKAATAWEGSSKTAKDDATFAGAVSLSGVRNVKPAGKTDFEQTATGGASENVDFRKAAKKDGPERLTEYSKTSWEEYFAEAFSFYISDPETFQRLRPNLFAYFAKTFPK
jgi:hypothetical protein